MYNGPYCSFPREWEGFESIGLQLGKVSPFLGKMIPTLFANLYDHAKVLSTNRDNVTAYYQLLFLLMLELSHPSVGDMVSFLSKLQDLATREDTELSHQQCIIVHAIVAGILHLVAQISTNPILKDNVSVVIVHRREAAIELLPEGLFRGEGDRLNESEVGGVSVVGAELLFVLKEDFSMKRASESGASIKKSFG